MSERWPDADVGRPAAWAMTGLGALLFASAAACGGAPGDDPPAPTPPPTQPAGSMSPSETPATTAAAATFTSTSTSTGTSASAPAPAPRQTPVALDDALIERARSEGTVSVIVTLDIPYRPEAELAGPAEVAAQRAAIAAAQDALAASVPGAAVTTRYTLFPQLACSVDEAALRQLASSPLVLAIQENALSAPT